MCYKFFCPIDGSEDSEDSPFKTMQKANAAAHAASPVPGILNVSPLIVGCRQGQRSHHLLYKIIMAESKELFPFPDRVDERGNSLQCTEIASLAVLPLLQLFFLSAGLTKHKADSCMGKLAWNIKCVEPLYNVLAKTCLLTSNLHTYSNALWHREKMYMKIPSLP